MAKRLETQTLAFTKSAPLFLSLQSAFDPERYEDLLAKVLYHKRLTLFQKINIAAKKGGAENILTIFLLTEVRMLRNTTLKIIMLIIYTLY